MMENEERASLIIQTEQRLRNDRSGFENLWQECAEFVCPRLADFNSRRAQGEERRRKVYDTTAIVAAELLASAIVGIIANPAAQWCFLSFIEEENNENSDAVQWLTDCTKVLLNQINRPETNFAQALHEAVSSLVVFGTSGVFEGYNDGHLFFSSHFLGDFVLDEDATGKPMAWFRKMSVTARQYFQLFGENVPERVKGAIDNKRFDERFEIVHAIYRKGYFLEEDASPFAYNSVYTGDRRILSSSGFYEQPFFSPRWEKSSVECYGRSPAISLLPDIKMLQAMMKETLVAAQLANRPPVLMRDSDQLNTYNIIPGGVVKYSGNAPQVLNTGSNHAVSLEMMNEVRNRIRMGFYNDQLMFYNGVTMTATEVVQRTEEKMRLMSPILGRIQSELLGPLVERAFGVLRRAGLLPEPPDNLDGSVQVRYASPLETAQRKSQMENAQQFLAFAGGVMQMNPPSVDGIKFDRIIRDAADVLNLKGVTLTEDELEKVRTEKAALQQQQQAVQEQMIRNEMDGQVLNNEALAQQIRNGQ